MVKEFTGLLEALWHSGRELNSWVRTSRSDSWSWHYCVTTLGNCSHLCDVSTSSIICTSVKAGKVTVVDGRDVVLKLMLAVDHETKMSTALRAVRRQC